MAGSFPKQCISLPHERHATTGATILAMTNPIRIDVDRGEMRASNDGKSLTIGDRSITAPNPNSTSCQPSGGQGWDACQHQPDLAMAAV